MQRYCNSNDLKGALEAARALHEIKRDAVRKQEALLRASADDDFAAGLEGVDTDEILENYTYTLDALLKPQLVSGDPDVTVRGPSGVLSQEAAMMLPHAIKKIQHESQFTREAMLTATDTILGWGVMEVRYEDLSLDQSEDAVIPVARHVNPNDVMALPGPMRWEHCGAFFRRRIKPKAMLLAEAKAGKKSEGWKVEVIEGLDETESDVFYDAQEVIYYEGWMLPADETANIPGKLGKASDMHHGIDFLCSSDGSYIRNPVRHVGPKRPPYYLAGATQPTDCIYPVGIAVAASKNNDLVEEMIQIIATRVRRTQTLVFVKSDKKDLETVLNNAIDDIVPVGMHFDVKDAIQEVTTGGATQEQYMFVEMARGMMDRVSGISDMQRGQTGSRVSATEASIVNSASGARLDGIIAAFYQMMESVVVEQCWALVSDKDIRLHLSSDASTDSEEPNPEWVGGLPEGVSYHTLGLEISVSNGHRTNPEILANRYVRGLDIAMMVSQLKERFPDSNVDEMLRKIYTTMEIPELRDIVLGDPAPQPAPGGGGAPGNGGAVTDTRAMPAVGQGAPVGVGMGQ